MKMSREKGSQFLLAEYVNNQSIWLNSQILKSSVQLLNEINDELAIEWISPLKQNNYKEYRDNFLNVLGNLFRTTSICFIISYEFFICIAPSVVLPELSLK